MSLTLPYSVLPYGPALSKECFVAVPAFEGLTIRKAAQVVELRRKTGDFTSQEVRDLTAALAAHDPAAIAAQRAADLEEFRQARQTLRQAKQQWGSLTNAQKLDAILVLLRYLITRE